MTNRTEYIEAITDPSTKEQEIFWIANLLAELGKPITLPNAQALLELGLQNAPDKWLLRVADLVVMWPQLIGGEARAA